MSVTWGLIALSRGTSCATSTGETLSSCTPSTPASTRRAASLAFNSMKSFFSQTFGEVTDEDGLPVARRRDGWSFLVAAPIDLAELERMGKKLVDAAALIRTYDDAEDLGPRVVAAHGYLDALIGDFGFGDPEDLVRYKMGMSKESYRAVEAV